MTTITAVPERAHELGIDQARGLRAWQGGIEKELRQLWQVGMEDSPRAEELRRTKEAIVQTLEAWHAFRSEEAGEADRAEVRRRKGEEKRAEAEKALHRTAVEFLEAALADGPREQSELEEESGVPSYVLAAAARELGLRSARRYESGGRVGGPEFWGKVFLAGWGAIRKV